MTVMQGVLCSVGQGPLPEIAYTFAHYFIKHILSLQNDTNIILIITKLQNKLQLLHNTLVRYMSSSRSIQGSGWRHPLRILKDHRSRSLRGRTASWPLLPLVDTRVWPQPQARRQAWPLLWARRRVWLSPLVHRQIWLQLKHVHIFAIN